MSYNDVIAYFKTKTNACARLNISRQALHRWKLSGVPPDRQNFIQLYTRGKLKADPK